MKLPAFVVATLLAWTAGAQPAPRASIVLLSQAQVTGEGVTLGQVAHLQSTELPLLRQLVDLPIGRVPRDGQPAFVRREALAHWVQRETGLAAADLAWQGSEVARVTRVTHPVKGSELAAAAREALRSWMAQHGVAGEAWAARVPRDLDVPAGDAQLRPRPLDAAVLRPRMLVWVEVWAEGAFVRAVPVPLQVEATVLPAAASPPVSAASSFPRPSRGEVLVERGAWATLRSTDGVVSLESKVTVLQDGRAGEQVRVRAPGGGGIVFARVVGPAQLELAP